MSLDGNIEFRRWLDRTVADARGQLGLEAEEVILVLLEVAEALVVDLLKQGAFYGVQQGKPYAFGPSQVSSGEV